MGRIMLSEEAISEFRGLYKTQFGVELTLDDATQLAYRLLGLYKAVLGSPQQSKEPNERV